MFILIFILILSLETWFPQLRWYHLTPDRYTWGLTWGHPCLHMPMSSLGELSLEQVSKARSTSYLLERFPACLRGMWMSINSLSLCFYLSVGYGFLPTEPMETVARRQELIHKQNIARWVCRHSTHTYCRFQTFHALWGFIQSSSPSFV